MGKMESHGSNISWVFRDKPSIYCWRFKSNSSMAKELVKGGCTTRKPCSVDEHQGGLGTSPHWMVHVIPPYWGDVWMLHVISPVDFLSRSMTRMIPGCNDTHITLWYSIYLVILMVNDLWLPICMTAPAQYIAHLEFQSATGIHFSIGRRNLHQQAHRFIIVLLATTQFGFSW